MTMKIVMMILMTMKIVMMILMTMRRTQKNHTLRINGCMISLKDLWMSVHQKIILCMNIVNVTRRVGL